MSRYVIEKNDTHEVTVGWDPPMGTYFAQEHDAEGECIWWVGYMMREIPTLSALTDALLKRGLSLPRVQTAADLANDANEPWEPGPMQALFGFTGKEGGPTKNH